MFELLLEIADQNFLTMIHHFKFLAATINEKLLTQ
jgi:hypothetical protein